jgi:hypothetical protein
MKRTRRVIFIDAVDEDLPWDLRRAALDHRTTLRGLVNRILTDWLEANDYRQGAPPGPAGGATPPPPT